MSLLLTHQRSEGMKPGNLKAGKRGEQHAKFQAIGLDGSKTEDDYSQFQFESVSNYQEMQQELQQELQSLLTALAGLKTDRNQLRLKVQGLEKALLDEIQGAQDTLCFMDTIYARLETQYIKLSQWNTFLGLGASLLGLTCVILVQTGRN
eukprot:TRINITY_DN3768_c0_g1_i7.p4 TRINITY_DN3768_c0_g1~~TRINITY_DN3768_c0_g1_i7.p4  ORF type:complete len:150 (-),score=10.89 TRINITY_DN3768_c0_g1_i7:1026-1475(-)